MRRQYPPHRPQSPASPGADAEPDVGAQRGRCCTARSVGCRRTYCVMLVAASPVWRLRSRPQAVMAASRSRRPSLRPDVSADLGYRQRFRRDAREVRRHDTTCCHGLRRKGCVPAEFVWYSKPKLIVDAADPPEYTCEDQQAGRCSFGPVQIVRRAHERLGACGHMFAALVSRFAIHAQSDFVPMHRVQIVCR